jgi:chromosome partitioning protein
MILAIINYKGGVGKTTSTINIGAGLARRGKRVLLVDTDPQANLTTCAGLQKDERNTLYELLKHDCDISDAIRPETTLGCAVLPACEKMSRLVRELADELDKERILRDWLTPIQSEYDYILIDCAPTRNLLNDNALVAADEAYIPVQTEHLAAQGLGLMADRISEMRRKRVNTTLHITGIIPTLFKTNQKSCQGVIDALRESYGDVVFKTIIRDSVALREAPAAKKDVFALAPQSSGAADYTALVEEVLQRTVVSAGGSND